MPHRLAEFGFVNLPEAFSTGSSSAMPQKKNPDLTEPELVVNLLASWVPRQHLPL